MAINPLIALQGQGIDTATPTANLVQMKRQSEQMDLQRAQNQRQERMMDLREQQVSADILQQAYERQDKAEQRRLRNVALASAQLQRVLETGGPEAARSWLEQNKEGTEGINLPTQDTQEAIDLIESGNIDQLKTGLSNNVYIGESLGLIETPEGQWQPIYDDEGNILAQRSPDGKVVSDPRAGSGGDYTARNILLPSGDKVSGRTNEQGRIEIVNDEGEFEPAPSGAQIISTSLQGDEKAIGATKPEIRKFRDLEAKLPVVERLQERIAEGLSSDEFVGGVSGSTIKLFNSFRNQVEQLYSSFNRDRPENERDAELSVDKYRDVFGDVTNVSSQVKSGILDLAYMTLKAKGEERVSDQDIRLELQSFGLDTNDPKVIMNRVNEKVGDLYANYGQRARQLEVEPQFQFSSESLNRGSNVQEFASEEEANKAIEEGRVSIGDTVIVNGKRFRVEE